MILPFSQLEEARRNPRRFGQTYSRTTAHFNSRNFRTYVVAAVRRFHRGMSKDEVLSYFDERCGTKLSTINYSKQRTENYGRMLGAYCDAFSPGACQYIESGKKTSLIVGSHQLAGKVDRFDLRDPDGYRATAFQLAKVKWEHELRWPLTQKGIALDMGCATSEVEIGVFSFDTGQYGYVVYSDDEIAEAEAETNTVLNAVQQHLP